jgi:60 kDa SS-A/Ro ribonucleoprotein
MVNKTLFQTGETVANEASGRGFDNARMLRTFVQILRSGAVGRRSLGTMPRRLVREWLDRRSDAALVAASVGRSPSIADIIRMVHPKPKSKARSALNRFHHHSSPGFSHSRSTVSDRPYRPES